RVAGQERGVGGGVGHVAQCYSRPQPEGPAAAFSPPVSRRLQRVLRMSVVEPPSLTPSPLLEPEIPRRKPKIKKLRLLLIVMGLGALALVSTVFGMMMAVASDLPALENDPRFTHVAKNSILVDDQNRELGVLVNNQNLVFVPYAQIAPVMRDAII